MKSIATAGLVTVVFSLPVAAQQSAAPSLEDLFAQLQQPEVDSDAVESQIVDQWSRSGSASMDLLLARGTEALETGDLDVAIGFLTALVDHAPEFAYGYTVRSRAYFLSGLPGPALADIQSALALEPRQFEALSGLAVILEDLGSKDEALAAWQLLAKLTPHDEAVREALARLDRGPRGTAL